MALSLGKKETRLVGGKAGRPKSALLEQAFKRASRLSRERQDAIALHVLDTLRNKPDPAVERFQSLIENKYTRGLTAAENTELDRLEADFRKSDETFYGSEQEFDGPPHLRGFLDQ